MLDGRECNHCNLLRALRSDPKQYDATFRGQSLDEGQCQSLCRKSAGRGVAPCTVPKTSMPVAPEWLSEIQTISSPASRSASRAGRGKFSSAKNLTSFQRKYFFGVE